MSTAAETYDLALWLPGEWVLLPLTGLLVWTILNFVRSRRLH
jgi:hypothetical protein